jgi:hypothetical protein
MSLNVFTLFVGFGLGSLISACKFARNSDPLRGGFRVQ